MWVSEIYLEFGNTVSVCLFFVTIGNIIFFCITSKRVIKIIIYVAMDLDLKLCNLSTLKCLNVRFNIHIGLDENYLFLFMPNNYNKHLFNITNFKPPIMSVLYKTLSTQME